MRGDPCVLLSEVVVMTGKAGIVIRSEPGSAIYKPGSHLIKVMGRSRSRRLVRLPKVKGSLDIGRISGTPAKGAAVIPVLNHLELLRVDGIAVALKAKIVGLAGRRVKGEKHKAAQVTLTNAEIKSVMAMGTGSYWICF
jgi:hypothetical protein